MELRGKPRHRTAGPEASQMGGEQIKFLIFKCFPNTSQRCLDFARHDEKGTEHCNEITFETNPTPRSASKRGRRLSDSGFGIGGNALRWSFALRHRCRRR